MLCNVTPVGKPGEGPVDPDFGVPAPPDKPVVIPPLPGIWPPPGQVMPPINLPPVWAMPPIFIDGTPEKPINLPPGLWPPLPPEIGGGPIVPPPSSGGGNKAAILVAVVGLQKGDIWSGYRWFVFEKPPEGSGPKR